MNDTTLKNSVNELSTLFVNEHDLAKELNRDVWTLRHWRRQRVGPAWLKFGKSVWYRRNAVVEWLNSLEVAPVRESRRTRRSGRAA